MRALLPVPPVILLLAALVATGCTDEGTIKVHKVTFNGVKSIDLSRLKAALVTKQSSIIPWGKKHFFNRAQFESDLKRVEAFYSDRGYPDARVTNFDAKLN